ncbi:type IV pilus assembly protein PilB [Persephonella hydrogeniphila]|uniref:Type IV pilus assembly protein PilB n=1 Tax=Persephonella hydrogeniphila TaxID=198703 RepID=A0A285NKJ5_9AQUI|nr:ATPase, T2SS/T4P/T4SS family [Persephonella hydrogeniphila]SNZ09989.1 type IV pilus assembly protein PilB [Persephonella hydrogeniphila]
MENTDFKSRRKLTFLRLMVSQGIVPAEKVRNNPNVDSRDFTDILTYLVESKIADENQIKDFFVNFLNLKPFDPNMEIDVEESILSNIPYSYMTKKKFAPVYYDKENEKLTIAAFNPIDKEIIHYLKFLGIKNIEILVASYSEIQNLLESYSRMAAPSEILENIGLDVEVEEEYQKEEEINVSEVVAGAEEAPIVKASRLFIVNAVRQGASDIHIEPFEKELRVRYRIDGILRTVQRLPVNIKDALVARYKIMANLDIAEKRLPQDGRIRVKIDRRPIDLRVSIIPTVYGEKVVMRIQDAQSYLGLKLEDLGFEPDDLEKIRKAIYSPWGMVLVTGPTGSGKTTTLYTALMERNTEDVNISTAEDPVEVSIPGINQVQIKEHIGLTFAEALRSFLRQDPDIILVGEIRDRETAEISIKAALTGHLVFSTLHTNDAPSSITRLIDIGVENFLVGTAVNMIIAQRLVRKLCDKCKLPANYPKEFWLGLGLTEEDIENGKFYVHNPEGCERCNKTGYRGRTAVHEILEIDDTIRKAILSGANAAQLKELAIKNGMRTLFLNALQKVKRGITDIAEVERVLIK